MRMESYTWRFVNVMRLEILRPPHIRKATTGQKNHEMKTGAKEAACSEEHMQESRYLEAAKRAEHIDHTH